MKRYKFLGCWAAGLLMLVAGCASKPEDVCASDRDCGNGICNAQQVCVPEAKRTPGLEVWPPAQNNQGWVVQEFPEGSLGRDGSVLVALRPGVAVKGRVFSADSGQELLIPARIVARRDSLLPALPKVQFETSQAGGKQDAAGQGYLLWLTPGHTYSFQVMAKEPYDVVYPPLVMSGVKVDGHMSLDFAMGESVEVKGRIAVGLTGQPLPRNNTNQVMQVRVRAFNPDGLEQSTIAKTVEDGLFTFKVPRGVLAYTVRVESAPGQPPIPTMECAGMTLGMLPLQATSQDLGTLKLPTFNVPLEPFTVTVLGSGGVPVANAKVTFSRTLDVPSTQNAGHVCTARYSQTSTTNADGKVDLFLDVFSASNKAMASYEVTVESPPSSPFASQWIPRQEVVAPGSLKAYELAPRFKLSGQVIGPDGSPVANAVITGQEIALASPEQQPRQLPAGEATGTTREDGAFDLYVAGGIWNFDVQPPDGSGLPGFGMTSKIVNASVDGLLFSMPSPQTLRGQVVIPAAQGVVEVPDAQVKVYELVPETNPPVTRRAALRARSVTNAEGTFYLVLPPTP